MPSLQDAWEIDLTIGGEPFSASPSTVPQCNIITTVHQNLPSLQLTIHDADGKFTDTLAGGDGTTLDLALGDGRGGIESATWSIQGEPQIEHGRNYYKTSVNCVLDKVGYMRRIVSGLNEGSSSEAIKKVAEEVGLKFDGDSSSDKQVWLPNNKTIAGFVKHLAGHAYKNEGSAFVHGITEGGTLKFKDLSGLLGGGTRVGVGGIPMLTYSVLSKGAIGNHNRAAGSTTAVFKPDGVLDELNKIPALKFSNNMSFGSATQAAIGALGGKLDHAIRDAGNTHENFIKARHQNSRIRSTFTLDLHGLFDLYTGLNLLDPAEVVPLSITEGEAINTKFAGNYIVTAKTRSLTNAQYNERITFTTQGSN